MGINQGATIEAGQLQELLQKQDSGSHVERAKIYKQDDYG
jgi:hypothetical protein